MTQRRHIKSLEKVTLLREREVDRLSADMSGRRAAQTRYVNSIARLEQLCQSSGASGANSSPAQALNCGAYKQGVMKMAEAHRVDLSLHEADTAVAQRALITATHRREAFSQALEREREAVRQSQSKREQKVQDETAVQVWTRTGK